MDVIIGRFQPLHKGHIHLISQAQNPVILVGSSGRVRDLKNPFTFEERKSMILKHFPMLTVLPIKDYLYNDALWHRQVREVVDGELARRGESYVKIVGYEKDDSSVYLLNFQPWAVLNVAPYLHDGKMLNATDIRHLMYTNELNNNKEKIIDMCGYNPREFFAPGEFGRLVYDEYEFQEKHTQMWANAPYDPTFNCADAVVIQSGHVLLIERKNAPGKGTWALPGGYIHPKEKLFDAAIRELREETGLKVPEKVLRGSVFASHLFDHPDRSLRGRVFSHAFGFKLDNSKELPHIKGNDDAKTAKWFPLDKVPPLFEDHSDILEYFVTRIKD